MRFSRIPHLRPLLAFVPLTIALTLPARAATVDLGGLSGTLTGGDRYKAVMASLNPHGKLKKKTVGHGVDPVSPAIALTSGGSAGSGSFTITNYEDFPVAGTWTLAASGAVALVVDGAAFAAQKGPEICPGDTCTPTATWTPKSAKLNARTNTLKVKWTVSIKEAHTDGTYFQETFQFKGAGPLAP